MQKHLHDINFWVLRLVLVEKVFSIELYKVSKCAIALADFQF